MNQNKEKTTITKDMEGRLYSTRSLASKAGISIQASRARITGEGNGLKKIYVSPSDPLFPWNKFYLEGTRAQNAQRLVMLALVPADYNFERNKGGRPTKQRPTPKKLLTLENSLNSKGYVLECYWSKLIIYKKGEPGNILVKTRSARELLEKGTDLILQDGQ